MKDRQAVRLEAGSVYPALLLVVLFLLFVLFPIEPREFLPSGQRKAGIGDRKTHFEKRFS